MPDRRRIALIALAALVAVAALAGALVRPGMPSAEACAFDPRRPYAYEGDQGRALYLQAIEASSVNALLPNDAFFALQPIERGSRGARVDGAPFIPATLLKTIAWVESNLTMAQPSVRFESVGDGLVSFDCGHGVMQVTTGMTVPLGADNKATSRQASIATHFAYNIARGAQILAEKWNSAPEQRPVAGTDTQSDPQIIENWYFAVWAYNGFTGPGASISNHPADPTFGAFPHPAWRCDGTQARNRFPYQEIVWGCMARPESRSGRPLWEPLQASLPNLQIPAFFAALSPANFVFPYSAMDIPTPQPAHLVQRPTIAADVQARLIGAPVFEATSRSVTINLKDRRTVQSIKVPVRNAGTGILTWQATASDNFLIVDPPAGAAAGSGVPCGTGACSAELTITVNPTLLPAARASGTVTLTSPTGGTATIRVEVSADFEIGAPGTSRAP